MTRAAQLVFIVGIVTTAMFVVLDIAGVFRSWEHRSIDTRYRLAPRDPEPMTSEIVHVDIDDGALIRVGRWPWDRGRIAAAIDEIGRLGARTVAVDLLLPDAQQYPAGTEPDTDLDGLLVDALANNRSVLAVLPRRDRDYEPTDWIGPDGEDQMAAVLRALSRDILMDIGRAADEAAVTGRRRARLYRHPLALRQAAIRLVLAEADAPKTYEALVARLLPAGEHEETRELERRLIEPVWNEYRGWRALREHVRAAGGDPDVRGDPPLPRFAQVAAGVGTVNVDDDKDPDGAIRRMVPLRAVPGGEALSLGLAAAATHRGLDLSAVDATRDTLFFGTDEFPLRDGRLWIDWATTDTTPPWEGLFRGGDGGDDEQAAPGHVTIAQLVELNDARRAAVTNRARLLTVSELVVRFADPGHVEGSLSEPRLMGAAADEVEWTLEDDGEVDPEIADHVANCRLWQTLQASVIDINDRIETVESALGPRIANKLVFVGWTATGAAADFVPTAVGSRTPGVVVHAMLADMMLTGRARRFLPRTVELTLVLVLGLVAAGLTSRFSVVKSLAAMIAIGAIYVWLTSTAFASFDLLLPLVAPLAGGGASWLTTASLQATLSQRERAKITRQFRQRVSPQLVDHLAANPAELTMDGTEREITIFVADLAGFTTISEQLGGAKTVSTLNRYLGRITDVLVENGAYVNKFLGDGVLAFWSAFEADPDQASKAVRAARACLTAVRELNADPEFPEVPPLGLRIGIATGSVVVGDCGAPPALNDYTVIGDSVNLAARLESANKQLGSRVLIDGRTRELTTDEIPLRPFGRIVVVGQSVPVEVHEVLERELPNEVDRQTHEAIEAYREGRFDEAERALAALAATGSAAAFVELYRRAIEEARDDGFDGAVHLRSK